MPLHLEPLNCAEKLRGYRSVLIVSCPVCPPASLASDSDSPLVSFFWHGIKTPAYEHYLGELQDVLNNAGVQTSVFTSYLPSPATCLWSSGQRQRLLKKARGRDAVLVMGCASAQATVEQTLEDLDCDVILGMELVGITNASLKFNFPLNVTLVKPMRVAANERVEPDNP